MPSDLLSLPDDVLLHIASHLTRREAARGARSACRSLRDACRALDENPSPSGLHHRHRLFVANSRTSQVVEMSFRGSDPPRRVAVGKAWRSSSKKRKRKPKSAWLTGIAHHRGMVYCCQYQPSCVVVLDADDGLRYVRSHALPDPSPEGIACDGRFLYVTFAGGQVRRAAIEPPEVYHWANAVHITPAWGQSDPCYMDRKFGHHGHYAGSETPGVVWGAALGPDGALYVAADRDHDPGTGNYATPPDDCAACAREGRSGRLGAVFRASWNYAEVMNDAKNPGTPLLSTWKDELATRRPSGIAFATDADGFTVALVASMDRRVSAFRYGKKASLCALSTTSEITTCREQTHIEETRVFLDLAPRDAAGRAAASSRNERDDDACDDAYDDASYDASSSLPDLQPFDAHAPPFQGGRVFVTVHRGVDAGEPGSDDTGVVVCDARGNELAFVRDDALAAHANALAGEC